MDVFHHHLGVGDGQVVVGEVPEALDAQAHQTAAQLLGSAAGQAEDGHLWVVFGAELLQLVDVQNLDAADLLAHLLGGVVEGGDELVSSTTFSPFSTTVTRSPTILM